MAPRISGQKLKARREANGYRSARTFAELLGVPESKYGRFERKGQMPEPELLLRICRLLDAKIEDLLYTHHDQPAKRASEAVQGAAADKPSKAGSRRLQIPASDGFSDEADASNNRLARMPTNEQQPLLEGMPSAFADANALDLYCWKLASELASASRLIADPKSALAGTDTLGLLKATGDFYKRLQKGPFDTISTTLNSVDLANLPPNVIASLDQAIKSFVRLLDQANLSRST